MSLPGWQPSTGRRAWRAVRASPAAEGRLAHIASAHAAAAVVGLGRLSPSVNEQMTFLDCGVLLAYIMAIVIGASVSSCLWLAARWNVAGGAVSSFRAKPHFPSRPAVFFGLGAPLPSKGRIRRPVAASVSWSAGRLVDCSCMEDRGARGAHLAPVRGNFCVALAASTGWRAGALIFGSGQ